MIGDPNHKVPTIRELNVRYRAFWKEQNELMHRRLADPVLLELVKDELDSYKTWPIPVPNQKSFESMLENAERAKQRVLAHQGQKGGRAKKPDALQELIISWVRGYQGMTVSQLLKALEREPPGSTIIGEALITARNSAGMVFCRPNMENQNVRRIADCIAQSRPRCAGRQRLSATQPSCGRPTCDPDLDCPSSSG
jgi:hypothetical protein